MAASRVAAAAFDPQRLRPIALVRGGDGGRLTTVDLQPCVPARHGSRGQDPADPAGGLLP